LNPADIPGVLVRGHGPFCWGATPATAAHNSVILEALARMAYYTAGLVHELKPLSSALHDKHYLRKHGSAAYYGQPPDKT
jgi:L-ribulose-5-phosphate 4-epimerase